MINIKFSKYQDTKNHKGAYITELHTFSNRKFRRELIFLREDMLEDIRFLNYQKYIFERDYDRKVNIKIDRKTNKAVEIPFSGITGKWTVEGVGPRAHVVYCAEQKEEKKHNYSSINVIEKRLVKISQVIRKYEIISIPKFNKWYSQNELMMCGELIFRRGGNIPSSFSEYNIIHSHIAENLASNLKYIQMQLDSIEIIDK